MRVCDTLRPAFFVENLVANRSRFAGSCACYIDKWNVEKPVLSKFAQLAFDLRSGLQMARIMKCGLLDIDNVMILLM